MEELLEVEIEMDDGMNCCVKHSVSINTVI